MSAFTPQPSMTTRTPIRAVLIAGTGETGRMLATDLLDALPLLRCPVITCIRDADIGPLQARIDGVQTRWAADGAPVDSASIWIAPPGRHTFVRDGRFVLSEADGAFPAEAPSLGKLYHSLRSDYGSRLFAIVVDTEPNTSPSLRLLAQRGARVVSPIDNGPDGVASHWTADRITAHLGETLAVHPEAAVA